MDYDIIRTMRMSSPRDDLPAVRSPRDSLIKPEEIQAAVLPSQVVSEGYGWLPFSEAKDELTNIIARVKKYDESKVVIVDDNFFATARYQIVRKDRDEHESKKLWLLSEQDTCYENLTSNEATYTFRTSFEQTSSATLTISKGKTLSIGAVAGGGFGGNVGLTGGAEFSKLKCAGEGQSHTETKQLMVAIPVPSKTAVVVKELVYHTECSARCNFYLLLGIKTATFKENLKNLFKHKGKGKTKVEDELMKKDEIEGTIKYTTNGKEKEMKVSDLLEDPDLERQPWVCKLGDTICIKLYSRCTFTKTEHALETEYQKSDPGRLKRITSGKVTQRQPLLPERPPLLPERLPLLPERLPPLPEKPKTKLDPEDSLLCWGV